MASDELVSFALTMLDILEILIGLLDLANVAFAAVKYWRISAGCFVAASSVLLVCLLSESPSIRVIVGFHLAIALITAAIIWETRRGNLQNGKTE